MVKITNMFVVDGNLKLKVVSIERSKKNGSYFEGLFSNHDDKFEFITGCKV